MGYAGPTWPGVLQLEVLVSEFLAIDRCAGTAQLSCLFCHYVRQVQLQLSRVLGLHSPPVPSPRVKSPPCKPIQDTLKVQDGTGARECTATPSSRCSEAQARHAHLAHEVSDDTVEAGPLEVQWLALAPNSLLACMTHRRLGSVIRGGDLISPVIGTRRKLSSVQCQYQYKGRGNSPPSWARRPCAAAEQTQRDQEKGSALHCLSLAENLF